MSGSRQDKRSPDDARRAPAVTSWVRAWVRKCSLCALKSLIFVPFCETLEGWLGNLDSNQDKQSQSLFKFRT
jgi:hypothetical protein